MHETYQKSTEFCQFFCRHYPPDPKGLTSPPMRIFLHLSGNMCVIFFVCRRRVFLLFYFTCDTQSNIVTLQSGKVSRFRLHMYLSRLIDYDTSTSRYRYGQHIPGIPEYDWRSKPVALGVYVCVCAGGGGERGSAAFVCMVETRTCTPRHAWYKTRFISSNRW